MHKFIVFNLLQGYNKCKIIKNGYSQALSV